MGHNVQNNKGTYSVDTYLPDLNKAVLLQRTTDTGFDNKMEKIRFRLTKRALEDHSIPPTEAVVINSFELGKQKSRDQKMELLKKVGLFTESDSVADNESESTQ